MNLMDWEQLYAKKEDWQRETVEKIKKDLLSMQDKSSEQFDTANGTRLVIIYGNTQVGKTTLILNMIGLKDECIDDVYNTLRAGIEEGNSSTSTAIIYSKSCNEQYGCEIKGLTDLTSHDVTYFDKEGMISRLKEIRQQVEEKSFSSEQILFISIPKNYFVQDPNADNISIMDMPGVHSKNRKEEDHVQNLMSRYIPMSSLCIIACTHEKCQGLEKLSFPELTSSWKRMDHRFVIVITRAYNDGRTKRYFMTKAEDRSCSFYDFVRAEYTETVKGVIGENQIEVYPIEIGKSLAALCNREIKDDADRKEIIDTKNRVLFELRKSIINHKGEKLISAIKNLKIKIEEDAEKDIAKLTQEIKEKSCENKDIKQKIMRELDKISIITDDDDLSDNPSENALSNLLSIKEEYHNIEYISGFSEETIKYIHDNQFYKSKKKGEYLKDKNEKVLENIQSTIASKVKAYVNDLIEMNKKADLTVDLSIPKIQGKALEFVPERDDLYPILRLFKRVYLYQIGAICASIEQNVNHLLKECKETCIVEIDKAIKREKAKIIKKENLIIKCNKNAEEYEEERRQLIRERQKKYLKRKSIKQQQKEDEETLNTWLEYAKEAYTAQRKDIIQQINESKQQKDKFLLILLLGLLDKDYRKIIGGSNEDGDR